MVAARLTHRRPVPGDGETLSDARFERGEVITRLGSAAIEGVMLAAVDRLLGGEGLDFVGEPRRRTVAELADAFDEECLAGREGRRQRVVESRRLDPAAVPQARSRCLAAEAAVARGDSAGLPER